MTERALQAAEIGRKRGVILSLCEELRNLAQEGHDGAAAVLRELAAHEVERLDAIRALVDHRDAGVANELLHAPFRDVAMASEHLLRLDRVGEAKVGEHALHDRGQEAEPVLRSLARFRVRSMAGLIL